MKKLISSIFVGCALFFSLSAESLSDIVDSKYLNELTSKGKVSLIHEKKDTSMTLVPKTVYTDKIKSDLKCANASGVPFLAEFLYLIPKQNLQMKLKKLISIRFLLFFEKSAACRE